MSELINNSQLRVQTLARIIKKLHAGQDPQAVKAELAALVRETSSSEIAAMEQQLIAEGMSIDEIKGMCDLHSQVMGDLVTERITAPAQPGHPVHTFQQENNAIAEVTQQMRQTMAGLSEDGLEAGLARWRQLHEQLLEVEKHYARKENVLFPYLERHGVTGPSQVMWGKDDDIRVLMKSLREALAVRNAELGDWKVIAEQIAGPLLDQVTEMINKEERILLPLALKLLSPAEWGAIWRDSPRFGACLVEPGSAYRPPAAPTDAGAVGDESAGGPAAATSIPLGAGGLTRQQLEGLFAVLPVDLTFVDADDRVAFFSEGAERIFARTPAIIGRKVQNCHPPQSVAVVERILSDFRSGAQNVAEFWIELHGRFVHIRYFAVRDAGGQYQGTLEVTQDLTRPRSLAGERRLLQYEDAS